MNSTPAPAPVKQLKILLIFAAADVSIIDQSTGYENAFRSMGHDVKVFRLARRIEFWSEALEHWAHLHDKPSPSIETVLRETADWVLIEAARYQPDLVLISSAMGFHPDALQLLKNHGYLTAIACTESPYDDVQYAHLAQVVDYLFTNEVSSVEKLQPLNPNTFYLPMAYDHLQHRPGLEMPVNATDVPPECDVLFVGSGFAERQRFLEAAVSDPAWPKDATFHCFGYWGWAGTHLDPTHPNDEPDADFSLSPLQPYVHDAISNDETAARYCRAKIVINLGRAGAGVSMNPRAYEIAACGAFQLMQDVWNEAHVILGKDIEYFDDPVQLAVRVNAWLSPANEEKRNLMAQRAHERIRGHSYVARAQTIIDITGIANVVDEDEEEEEEEVEDAGPLFLTLKDAEPHTLGVPVRFVSGRQTE